jgi:hypothetical protein
VPVELALLLVLLVAPPLLFVLLIAFYPPYLRRRVRAAPGIAQSPVSAVIDPAQRARREARAAEPHAERAHTGRRA